MSHFPLSGTSAMSSTVDQATDAAKVVDQVERAQWKVANPLARAKIDLTWRCVYEILKDHPLCYVVCAGFLFAMVLGSPRAIMLLSHQSPLCVGVFAVFVRLRANLSVARLGPSLDDPSDPEPTSWS